MDAEVLGIAAADLTGPEGAAAAKADPGAEATRMAVVPATNGRRSPAAITPPAPGAARITVGATGLNDFDDCGVTVLGTHPN